MPPNENVNGRPVKRPTAINRDGVKRDVIVIGASAGGVFALSELFAALPTGLPAMISVVLHRSAVPGELGSVLRRRSSLPVIEPKGTSVLKHGLIYLAPADHHLMIEHHHVTVQRGPKEHSARPAIDPLFRSAAAYYGKRVVGLLLTGCGEDGVSGLIAVSQGGGLTLAQDPQDAYMPYMPMNALKYDDVAGVFPLREMPSVITALVRGQPVRHGKDHVRQR